MLCSLQVYLRHHGENRDGKWNLKSLLAKNFHVRHRSLYFALYFLSDGFCANFHQLRIFSLALVSIKTIIPLECDS